MLAKATLQSAQGHRLTEAMMRQDFYPHPCAKVERYETMTSRLFFAGEFVYKVKKPVRFTFVDATTPVKRFQLCQNEVLLNARLAPEIYVGVRVIVERLGGYTLVPEAKATLQNVREFAVVMRRLPSDRMLDHMVAGGGIDVGDIQELAKRLAAFHAHSSIAKSRVWGSAQAISRLVTNNLAETEQLAADSVTRDKLAAVGKYLRRYISSHWQTLDNRARDGYVRDGHGDLRCDGVCLSPAGLAIINCVEYSEKLRYGDVASEVASLALDLERAQRSDLADELARAYVAETDDTGLLELLRFYKCHRSIFRGKLELLLSLQNEILIERRILARSNASGFFALAESHVTASRPGLLL